MSTPQAPAARDEGFERYDGFRIVAGLIAVMWVVEVIDSIDRHRLDRYGIEPRDAGGLVGIVAAPFLHVGFGHLISNTVPFAVMGFAIAMRGAARVITVTAMVALISGVGTWLIAPANTIAIGASGVVFGYATYLMARGFFDRSAVELAMGVIVAVVYGSALLGGLIPQDGISWQGHLFGAVGGIVAARALAPGRERPPAMAGA
jgi:membrane associated rhomboid family serine protease